MEPPDYHAFVSGSNDRYGGRGKKLLLIAAGVVVLAGAVIAGVVLLKPGGHDTNQQAVAISSTVAQVAVEQSGLVPKTISIKKGQEVTWTNNDATPHHLTADQSILGGFDTAEPLQQGDTYTYIFDHSGTFHYYDATDPTHFVGSVTVR